MSNTPFSVKCLHCNNPTKDPSQTCHLHRNMSAKERSTKVFGNITPKSPSVSASGTGDSDDVIVAVSARTAFQDFNSGVKFSIDASDGYGELYSEICDIMEYTKKPNEGMLAFTTLDGFTIFMHPEETIDIKLLDSEEEESPVLLWA